MAKKKEIRMRICKDNDCTCQVCGGTKKNSLDIFEVRIPDNVSDDTINFYLCDLCTDTLFNKALKATCYTQGRLKSNNDMQIIQKRRA